MSWSWVAMTIVVPVRLIRSSSRTMSRLIALVEVSGGLVAQQDLRAVDDGPGDGDPLLLTTGELVREALLLALEARPSRASRARAGG